MRPRILLTAAYVIIALALLCPLGWAWTEPVEIDGDLHLGAPRVVAVGETIYVVAVNPPRAWFLYSQDNGATWSEPTIPIDTSLEIEDPDLKYSNGWLHLVWKERTFYPQLYHARNSVGRFSDRYNPTSEKDSRLITERLMRIVSLALKLVDEML